MLLILQKARFVRKNQNRQHWLSNNVGNAGYEAVFHLNSKLLLHMYSTFDEGYS